jgi:hypothetical protein
MWRILRKLFQSLGPRKAPSVTKKNTDVLIGRRHALLCVRSRAAPRDNKNAATMFFMKELSVGVGAYSCCRLVLFVGPAHDDPERVVQQRSLQRLRVIPRCAHPYVAFFIGGQDHRHGLRVDRLDHRVRRCREKTVDLMRPRPRLRLRAAITVERRPDASEGEQGAVLVERESHHVLFLCLRVRLRRVLGKAAGRDKAAVLSAEPRPPVW